MNPSRYRQIRIVLKGLGLGTYKCLRDPRSATHDTQMDDPDVVTDHTEMDIEVERSEEDGKESPDSDELDSLDEAEELGNSEKEDATRYLRMLRAANLEYLDGVDEESLPGVIDFLPLVYYGAATKEKEQVNHFSERRKQAQEAWDKERSRPRAAE